MSPKNTSKMNKKDIENLSNNKPVVYKITNKNKENIYTGVAKRGRVHERIKEHLPGAKDQIPGGVKVKIDQKSTITEAEKSESNIIARTKPKHNRKGK